MEWDGEEDKTVNIINKKIETLVSAVNKEKWSRAIQTVCGEKVDLLVELPKEAPWRR